MAAKKYIAINEASTGTEERDLLKDVGEFAYSDQQEIIAPFDTYTLGIGSYEFVGSNWTNVLHPPSVLPAGGHFQVFTADNSKIILYTVSVASAVKNACFLTRAARLVITSGVAESWVYFAQGTTMNFGRIKVASEYDSGMATKMEHEVYGADWVNQYAFLDRGTRSSKINFNGLMKSGRYRINNAGGWSTFGSLNCPPTTVTTGYLEVSSNGCSVFQKYYPDDAQKVGLLFRERTEAGVWSGWFTASEGNMLVGADRVKVPTSYRRGIASGYAFTEVYSAAKVDEKFTYVGGTDISIVGNVISYTGSGGIGSETDPTVGSWIKAITSTNISNWNTVYSWGNHAGLYPLLSGSYSNPSWIASLAWSKITGAPDFSGTYAPLSRNLTVAGTSGRITSSAGAQSLAADRSWTLDLATVHAGLSGGSTTKTPTSVVVDAYGRTTGMVFSDIAFPAETDPTVPAWVKAITSTQISNWNTSYSWGNHSGLYSALGHTHGWTEITGKPTTFTPAAHTHPYTEVTGISAGAGITYTGGVIASTITQYTDAHARASISGGGLLSYNSTTGLMSLASVPWANITGAPDFSGSYVPLTRVIEVAGTAGRIGVSGGAQTLAATRSWTVDLATVHAGISGGSTTKTPTSVMVDAYGRTTAMTFSDIAFPVTSVNSQTGAVVLTTSHIAEGSNLYWTNARGDARYSQLGHMHPWTEISGKPLTFNPSSHTHPYTEVTGISAGAGITYTGGVIASTITQYTDALAKAALSAGTGISYGIVSGIIALAAIHSGISGGSTTKTPTSVVVDAYGRTTGMVFSDIAFPVTSVNGQTGAVSLTTSHIPEGTNLYWTNARGDARYSQLGHTHPWTEISGKPLTFNPSSHTHPYTEVTGISAGAGITYTGGVIASTITQYTDALAKAALSAGTGISYGIVSGIIALAAIHSGISGGSTTKTPTSVVVDAYGRTTGMVFSDIAFPAETDPTVPSHVKGITTTNISNWNAKADASGTNNTVAKFTGSSTLGNSQITDDGSLVKIGAPSSIGKFNVAGAIWASSDVNAVSYYVAGGGAVRAFGTMYLDAYDGDMYIRTGASYTQTIVAKSTGQVRFPTYTSSSSWSGTAAGLLGFDTSGNILTYEAVRTNAQNDARYLQSIGSHGHIISDVSGLQSALDGKTPYGHGHIISDVSGLQSALDGKPAWGDVYTRTQLNTSGGGGIVHWDNIIGEPATFPPTYHTHSISEVIGLWGELDGKSNVGHGHIISDVSGLQTALDGKTPYGHGHNISDVSGLQSALDGKADWGHNHDDLYYREYEVNSLLSAKANNSHTHWYTDIGGAPWLTSESDPYGISGIYANMEGGNMRITVYMRGGGNHQTVVTVFSGS